MKKFLRFIWDIIEIIVIVYVIALTAFMLCKNKFGFTQIGDYTISPIGSTDVQNIVDTKQGDLLVVKSSSDYNEGDVIYYYAVNNKKYIICSGVVKSVVKDNYSSLITLNDDLGTVITNAKILGKYATRYSNVGSFISFVQGRLGFLFCVLLPIMIIFIFQIYDFVIIIRFEGLEDEDEREHGNSDDEDKEKHIEKNEVEEEKTESKFKFDDGE